jgi:hypothetical protein
MAVTPLKINIFKFWERPVGVLGTKMGFSPFLCENAAVVSQISSLEANWGKNETRCTGTV